MKAFVPKDAPTQRDERERKIRARWQKEAVAIGFSESKTRLEQRRRSLWTCVRIDVEHMRANARQAQMLLDRKPGTADALMVDRDRLEVEVEVYNACADELEAA